MAAAAAQLARRCARLSRRFATITDPAAPSFAAPIGAGSITPPSLERIPGRAAQVERLKHDTPFDVVVVGGGCVGAVGEGLGNALDVIGADDDKRAADTGTGDGVLGLDVGPALRFRTSE